MVSCQNGLRAAGPKMAAANGENDSEAGYPDQRVLRAPETHRPSSHLRVSLFQGGKSYIVIVAMGLMFLTVIIVIMY